MVVDVPKISKAREAFSMDLVVPSQTEDLSDEPEININAFSQRVGPSLDLLMVGPLSSDVATHPLS